MSKLEHVVRPFESRGVSLPQRYVVPNQKSNPPVMLAWGRAGRGKTMGGSYSLVQTFYCDSQIVEKK